MVTATPEDLAQVLSVEVLDALHEDTPTIARLCSDADKQNAAVVAWIKGGSGAAKLAALSFDARRLACAALASHLGRLPPDVATVVGRVIA